MIISNTDCKRYDPSWDYSKDNSRAYTHLLHPYPATMIPQVAGRLIDTYAKPKAVVLDPFCGSGSVLLEAFIRGYNSYGIDINPLSLLISKVKTTPLDDELLRIELEKILTKASARKKIKPFNFYNINFWFKPDVITKLTILKQIITAIKNKKIRDFFNVAFSFTIRASSNTRTNEFKLYRIEDKKLHDFNPDVFEIFKAKAEQNIAMMTDLWNHFKDTKVRVKLLNEDTRYRTSIRDNSIDLIVTSPPYGDSRTTVAYGQFSRLFLQWSGFDGLNIDKHSLGGKPVANNSLPECSSPKLAHVINSISQLDKKRANDVMAFYIDLNKCFFELSRVLKKGGVLCLVIGNRTVKGIQLPSDEIIVDFGKSTGFRYVETIIRKIPNKRMPSKNSPTNKPGLLGLTMTEENIVIMEKGK